MIVKKQVSILTGENLTDAQPGGSLYRDLGDLNLSDAGTKRSASEIVRHSAERELR